MFVGGLVPVDDRAVKREEIVPEVDPIPIVLRRLVIVVTSRRAGVLRRKDMPGASMAAASGQASRFFAPLTEIVPLRGSPLYDELVHFLVAL